MQSLSYQKSSVNKRKESVLKVAKYFARLSKVEYPNISYQLDSGNTAKEALLSLVINQMYKLDFDITKSLLAVEANI